MNLENDFEFSKLLVFLMTFHGDNTFDALAEVYPKFGGKNNKNLITLSLDDMLCLKYSMRGTYGTLYETCKALKRTTEKQISGLEITFILDAEHQTATL